MNNVDINPSQGAPLWADRSLSGIAIAFLLFDAVIKLPPLGPVTDTLRELGFTPTTELARGLGVLLLLCTALYALPRTAAIGAVLLTGYLGGAIAIQLRAATPVFSHRLFAAYVGLFVWAGLLLRSPRLRAALLSRAA